MLAVPLLKNYTSGIGCSRDVAASDERQPVIPGVWNRLRKHFAVTMIRLFRAGCRSRDAPEEISAILALVVIGEFGDPDAWRMCVSSVSILCLSLGLSVADIRMRFGCHTNVVCLAVCIRSV